ncbi:hypothetical protein [Aliiroseovarius subalbicans]|uniref:hypothetical protein n=1 Tax=Aliiroseovarius subalbicans TaxID=2925840 RepID=UPI001F5945E1|nr:hypothetical protein [Aliiroseovarius subalbicans]MCI2399186.1 hypothetical protein [Aliiroseovarius subalbicans]
MTALTNYDRLESPGLYRASAEDQRRNVIVSVGEATLTITDTHEHPLIHWSLPAIRRLNPGTRPALFAPGKDSEEELELDDATMIDAIEKVRNVIAKRQPRPGRLRHVLTGGLVAAVLAAGVFWLPGALTRYTATVVPAPTRAAVGQLLLDRFARVAGKRCAEPRGTASLARLGMRVLGPGAAQIVVLPSGVAQAGHLPGGIILLNRALVEDYEEPDVAGGFILAEALRAALHDPMEDLLTQAGLLSTLRLLTSGKVPDEALDTYAETLLTTPPTALPQPALLAGFEATRLRATPYAYALDQTGETTLGLIEADPVPVEDATPLLDDGDWISLQGICGE